VYDRPNDLTNEQAETGRWLPLADAAGALGLRTPDALRQRIRRDRTRYRWRKTDRGDVLVWVEQPNLRPNVRSVNQADATERSDTGAALLAERDLQIARLEERLKASEKAGAELRRNLDEVRAELERERAAGADERRGHLEQIDRMTATIERLAAEAQLSWIERLLRLWRP
jgi:hypothetical protein